jgi:stringent starvation protein B
MKGKANKHANNDEVPRMDPMSTKPYLIRAIHAWCTDQGFTPYMNVIVDAQTKVPAAYVQNGQIVLNVGFDATHALSMENDWITFQGRFGGVVHSVRVPVDSVAAIYARENGHGMAFDVSLPTQGHDAHTKTHVPESWQKSAHSPEENTPGPFLQEAGDASSTGESVLEDETTSPRPLRPKGKRGGHLTRIK